jgi:hypothetical protein
MDEDYGAMSDPDFLAERRRVREELEHTPEHELSPELTARYQKLDEEFLRRASLAWAQARLRKGEQAMCNMPEPAIPHSQAARLLAVEVLLADPEALGDDVLESCLYLLRDRLQDNENEDEQVT